MKKFMANSDNLKVGCCGFRWSQKKYYSNFSLVEIQHTFYNPPKDETLIRWRNEAPEHFEFTLKAWQRITHLGSSPTYKRLKELPDIELLEQCGNFQPTKVVSDAYKRTLKCAQILNAKLILFQCPAKFTPEDENIENMRTFFLSIKKPREIRFAWEPRGNWPEALVQELCSELDLIHAIDPFKNFPTTQGTRYYRLHGRGRGNQKFKPSELKELLQAVRRDEETYVLFNNVYMIDDAAAFLNLASKNNMVGAVKEGYLGIGERSL